MQNTKHALVLTGIVLPGHAAESVWPALASYFRMEPDKVSSQLVPRAPVTLKESDDLGKLQGLQDGLRSIGADSEIHAIDERGSLFAVIGGKPRGPVPYAFVESKVATGDWSGNVEVAKVGESNWGAFGRLGAPAAPPPMAAPMAPPPAPRAVQPPAAPPSFAPPVAAAAPMMPPSMPTADPYASPYAAPDAPLVRTGDMLEVGAPLPAGEAIHAGFWRRCAAYLLDSLILLIPGILLNLIPLLGILLFYAGRWLYFALMESGPNQATLGKQAFGIKVTDDYGQPITFARATGRFFGGAVSNIILCIGYMMAGFTERKQALHDMMASTCVVFNGVEPGQEQELERPPMPWYGWAINIGVIALSVLAMVFYTIAMATLFSQMGR